MKREHKLAKRSAAEGGGQAIFPASATLPTLKQLKACVRNIIEKFGTVDVLVNNAANDARHPWKR